MSRLNLTDENKNVEKTAVKLSEPVNKLDELIPNYYANKQVLDAYTKDCAKDNAEIKDLMLQFDKSEYTANDITAKRIVISKDLVNEVKLMAVIKKFKVPEVVKTREYIDMESFESYLYNNPISTDFASELAACTSSTETVQLRVAKAKKKKEDK